jgi:hypothetical protein
MLGLISGNACRHAEFCGIRATAGPDRDDHGHRMGAVSASAAITTDLTASCGTERGFDV